MQYASAPDDSRDLSLAQRGLRGAAWSYGGTAVVVVGQLAYTALTARVISPAEFGAYATAQALIMLVGYFTLRAVGNAIIRNPALDRAVVGTATIMTCAAGAAVGAVVLAAAGPWAQIWRSEDAASLLRLLTPQVFLGCLAIVPMGLLRRQLRYRSATIIETASVLLGFAIGAGLAVRLRDANALVLGQVTSAAAMAAFSILATRSMLSLAFSKRHARELFSFSAQVSIQNLSHALTGILPQFAVSRSLGPTSLGFYSRAEVLVVLPQTFFAQGIYKTLYPIYPRFRDSREEGRRMMTDVTSVTLTAVWPLFAALAGFAPLVVELLLGARWAPVASIVVPLCILVAFDFVFSVLTSFAESVGYLKHIWVVQAVWTATLAGSLGVAVVADADMQRLALVAAGVHVVVHLFQIALFARARLIDAVGTLRAEAWAGSVALVWYLAPMLTTNVVSEQTIAIRLLASAVVVALLTVSTWLVLPRLPAGKAFSRRGIPITWRVKVSQLP